MKQVLRVHDGPRVEALEIEEGSTLSEALRPLGLAGFEAPCGGNGLCGKCRIRVVSGELSGPDAIEARFLSPAELGRGTRLACRARVAGEAEIEASARGAALIVSAGPAATLPLDPPARHVVVALDAPSLEDQGDDEARLLAALGRELPPGEAPSRVVLAALPGLALCARGGEVEAAISGGEALSVSPHRPARSARSLGIGADIGTTTVACGLLDLATGERLGTLSGLNAQRGYGADVLSRIAAAEGQRGLEALRDGIRSQVARMIAALAREAGARLEDVASVVLAGNTTMLHLLAGVPPGAIARSPFTPAFLGLRSERAAELGLVPHPGCAAFLLPGVSGYVGADIVAGMAAVGLHESPGSSFYIDLGTNGEIAFGGREGILCCSAAAGPAFEGALIEKGMGGVEGAVDSAWLENGEIRYGTIGGRPALGICGSGLVDAIAAFLEMGALDETGRIAEGRGDRLFIDRERDIYLSQADLRAAQLAKAAIAAGIRSLLAASGRGLGDVDRLYLAGGFGSLLGLRGAARIGLVPSELAERAIVSGNASLAGAEAACLSRAGLEACTRVASLCEYVELSGRPDFSAAYIDCMAFPER